MKFGGNPYSLYFPWFSMISEGIEVNLFTEIRLILEAMVGDDPLTWNWYE